MSLVLCQPSTPRTYSGTLETVLDSSQASERRIDRGDEGNLDHVNTVYCIFDCGPPRHISLCTNTGTSANPRWMCHGCNGARKAMGYAARTATEEAKKAFDTFRKGDTEAYKAKVRSLRVRQPNDPPGTCGMFGSNAERRVACTAFFRLSSPSP